MFVRNLKSPQKALTSDAFLREEAVVRFKHLTLLEQNYKRLLAWVTDGCKGSSPLYFLKATDFENLPDLKSKTISAAASQGLKGYWQRVWPHLTPTPTPKPIKGVYPRFPAFFGKELRG